MTFRRKIIYIFEKLADLMILNHGFIEQDPHTPFEGALIYLVYTLRALKLEHFLPHFGNYYENTKFIG